MAKGKATSVKVSTAITSHQAKVVACLGHCQSVRADGSCHRYHGSEPSKPIWLIRVYRSNSARTELGVANVVALSDDSRILLQAQASDTRGIRSDIQKLRQLVDSNSRWESSDEPLPFIPQPNILPLHSGHVNKGTDVLLEGRRELEVQVVWRPSWACDSACHCLCHESTQGRSSQLLDIFLRILF